MTLEEAQARIVELEEANRDLTTTNETLSQNNNSLTEELGRVRALNQKFFEKLTAQISESDGGKTDDDDEPPTCEEFAKNLKI